MIKKIFAIILSFSIVLSGMSVFADMTWETTGENLIYNPEFKSGIGDWYHSGFFQYDSAVGHNSPGAGLVTGRTNTNQQVYQPLKLEKDATYLVSVWVKLKDAKYDGKKIQLLASNSTMITDYGSYLEAYASKWVELKKTIVVDNAQQSVNVGVANYTSPELEFYIDDVSVKKVDTSKLYPAIITLKGATAVNVPQNGVNNIHLRCTAINQHGGNEGMHIIKNGLVWSLSGASDGVTINSEGVLTVRPNASVGVVTACAEYTSALGGTISDEIEIEIRPSYYEEKGNLFANGDFEKIAKGEWEGKFIVGSEETFDGGFSAFVSGKNFGQKIYLNPGKKYLVTAAVNANNNQNQFVLATDNQNITISSITVNTDNSEWHRVSAVLDTNKLQSTTEVFVSVNAKQANYYADSFFIAEMRDEFKDVSADFSFINNGIETSSLINGELTIKTLLKNGTEAKNLIIAAALYKDKDANKLEDVSFIQGVSLAEFEEKPVELEKKLTITDSSKQIVKFYVWNSNLTPQNNVKELVQSDEIVLHVYLNGMTDSKNNIFSSLGGARNKIQEICDSGVPYPKDGITVILHEGKYSSLYLLGDTYDSNGNVESLGSKNWLDYTWRKDGDKPITFKAAENETVIFSGEQFLDSSEFEPASEEEKNRLVEESAREHLVKINLFEQKTASNKEFVLGDITFPGSYQLAPFMKDTNRTSKNATMPELIIDGKVMQLSRYPNTGHMFIDSVVSKGGDYKEWEKNQVGKEYNEIIEDDDDGFTIVPKEDRFKKWKNAKDAIMYGYWRYSWSDQAIPIKSIDIEQGTITSKYPTTDDLSEGGYFYTYNLLEEIDSPGEYYIDREKGVLYLYPPTDTDINSAKVSLTQTSSPLIWLRSTHDYVFDGITFGNTRGLVVFCEGGKFGNKNFVFKNCSFINTGDYACLTRGINSGHGFTNCTFKDVAGGVSLSTGTLSTLTPGNSFVENCTFDNFSRITETYSAAIGLGGVGNRATHNTIKNAPHYAISFSGCDHIIEYNDISNILTEAGDMAAIYVGGSWISRGNKVRYNYIHDISSNIGNKEIYGNRVDIYGVYLDNLYSGLEVTGNIFSDFGGYAYFINGGRDNIFKKNVLVNTYGSLYMTAIGLDPNKKDIQNFFDSIDIVKNKYDSELWYKRFPEVYCIEDNEPCKPVDNIFAENLMVNTGYFSVDNDSKEVLINKDNLIYTKAQAESGEVGFIDYANKDYTLDINSPVFNNIKGFYKFSLEKAGALED
ncbi:MAG: carbohydrate binding domain-containing protein [Clostridia bacterium]|nr:carbohydrate binding domain-containing protein [Clostridia bacterium]